jgi:hypothetical protein
VHVRFVVPELRALDELRCDAIAVPFFQDERPLRGAAGLFDWRLCGRLSRLLVRGRVCGARGERTLVPARPRLAIDKLVLFGLGACAAFDEEVFVATIRDMLATLEGLGARTAALALPGRSLQRIPPGRAIELFLEVAGRGRDHDEVILIESPDAQRVMMPVIERVRRRVQALDVGAS